MAFYNTHFLASNKKSWGGWGGDGLDFWSTRLVRNEVRREELSLRHESCLDCMGQDDHFAKMQKKVKSGYGRGLLVSTG